MRHLLTNTPGYTYLTGLAAEALNRDFYHDFPTLYQQHSPPSRFLQGLQNPWALLHNFRFPFVSLSTTSPHFPTNMRVAIRSEIHTLCGKGAIRKGKWQKDHDSAFANCLAMTLFGGMALIAPTLIMALHPSLTTRLVTTCVATLLFALALAVGAEGASGKDVLAATAAYAAVLVVFLGTSMATTQT